jgi:ubiquinone/menaquinone biosynthesis C-methylase UbiE
VTSLISKQHIKVYDKLADEYERNIPNYFQSTKEGVEILSSNLSKGKSVLDVGCGTGLATHLLINKGFAVTSIDISSKMIEHTKRRNPEAKTIEGDFSCYPFSKQFDSIIALAFIHLFPKKTAEKIIFKMYKLIKPGGFLYIGTTKSSKSTEGWELKQDSFFPDSTQKRFRKHWTQKELKTSLEKARFEFKNVYLIDDPRQKVWMDFLMIKGF